MLGSIILSSLLLTRVSALIDTNQEFSGGSLPQVFDVCVSTTQVELGDTCFKLAQKNAVTLDALSALNPRLNCDQLFIDQKICLKNGIDELPGCVKRYTLQTSDTCFDISAKTGVPLTQIYQLNPAFSCSSLAVNQQVCLSYGAHETTAPVDLGLLPGSHALVNSTTESATTTTSTDGTSVSNDDGSLAAHNTVRRLVGTADLTWSNSLASGSKRVAATLASNGCRLEHSGNANVGENLYAIFGGIRSMSQAVVAWSNERLTWDNSTLNHYTQIVWSETQQVGCGAAFGDNCEVVVCQYYPPGNYLGESPF